VRGVSYGLKTACLTHYEPASGSTTQGNCASKSSGFSERNQGLINLSVLQSIGKMCSIDFSLALLAHIGNEPRCSFVVRSI
jgi:hypothetical protein